jgi:DNA-binding PadR family transcriptional regulator
MVQMGWITTEWGVSDNNRRAKFYAITRTGRRQLAKEARNWERMSGIIARFLKPGEIS